jgi:hypothetical protein
MGHEERKNENSSWFWLKPQASDLKPWNSHASVKTFVRPCSEKKWHISELDTA